MSNIRIDELQSTIASGLNRYSSAILTGVREAAKVTVDEMVQETKQRRTTRLAHGKYARAISSIAGEDSLTAQSRIWYVKSPRYRLTHLLNNGHKLRGGGSYPGDQHVTRAAEKAMTDFEERVKEVIRNAGD